mmetsp:Transcript_17985/g.48372  ORF Transcript_17985/g.48372 Transcript_17985/m.48372 type:complete len:310 (-) Transcript_17985:312-1241(-)
MPSLPQRSLVVVCAARARSDGAVAAQPRRLRGRPLADCSCAPRRRSPLLHLLHGALRGPPVRRLGSHRGLLVLGIPVVEARPGHWPQGALAVRERRVVRVARPLRGADGRPLPVQPLWFRRFRGPGCGTGLPRVLPVQCVLPRLRGRCSECACGCGHGHPHRHLRPACGHGHGRIGAGAPFSRRRHHVWRCCLLPRALRACDPLGRHVSTGSAALIRRSPGHICGLRHSRHNSGQCARHRRARQHCRGLRSDLRHEQVRRIPRARLGRQHVRSRLHPLCGHICPGPVSPRAPGARHRPLRRAERLGAVR